MRKRWNSLTLRSALVVGILAFPVLAQTRHGITPEDYFSFETISDPHLSPNGKVVGYVLTIVNRERNRRDSSIWLVPVDGSTEPRRFGAEGFNCSYPRWSPDGKNLTFLAAPYSDSLASEKSKAQIYLQPISGDDKATELTRLANGVQAYQWSPAGSQIVAVSSSGPGDGVAAGHRKSDVRHYTHIIYKFNDSGWDDGKRQHLWIVNTQSRESKQITDGEGWNDTDPQWSPDGTRIAFVSDRTGRAYDDIRRDTDVWVIPASGGSITKISDHEFADENPRWSPDGAQVLFTGKTAYHQFPKLYVASSSGKSASQVAVNDLDLIPAELHWSAPDAFIFVARVKGEEHVFRADMLSHTFSKVTSGPRTVHDLDVNASAGRMIYLANDFQHLDDLYAGNLDGTHEVQLTHLNSPLWSQLDLQPVERFQYRSTDGMQVEGFVVKPLGWRPDKKYPMVLVIHGGPRDMSGVNWEQELQIYAARGWAVFFCNPRGSIGYGEQFERAQINNWGLMDYRDVMAGVDAALKNHSWIDPTKLGVTGGSYGGFMTNWIISHTNRFRAAVTLRSLSNFISDEGTRWQPYGHEEYFRGPLFDDFDQYWEASPLKHARDVHTPTLILHSDLDFQLPLEQGEQWFRALQHYGVPSELVIFPRENHNLTHSGEPKHLVESLNWQVYWFQRYLDGDTNAKPPDEE